LKESTKAYIKKAKTELENHIFECEGLEEVKDKIQGGCCNNSLVRKQGVRACYRRTDRGRNSWNPSGAEKKTEKKNALSAEEKLKPVCMWQEHTNAKTFLTQPRKPIIPTWFGFSLIIFNSSKLSYISF